MIIMEPRTITLLAFVGLMLAAPALRAQSPCTDYHKFNCQRATDKRWSINGQSKSAAVQVGAATELNIIVYRGQDYRISVCVDPRTLGEQVAIRLLEKVREPRDVEETLVERVPVLDIDGNPTGEIQELRTKQTKRVFEDVIKVLWDNTEHDMVQEVEFSSTATKRIAVEVVAPGPSEGGKPKRSDKQFDIGCGGILIEHMPTPGLGF
jgi:hypothetical protein